MIPSFGILLLPFLFFIQQISLTATTTLPLRWILGTGKETGEREGREKGEGRGRNRGLMPASGLVERLFTVGLVRKRKNCEIFAHRNRNRNRKREGSRRRKRKRKIGKGRGRRNLKGKRRGERRGIRAKREKEKEWGEWEGKRRDELRDITFKAFVSDISGLFNLSEFTFSFREGRLQVSKLGRGNKILQFLLSFQQIRIQLILELILISFNLTALLRLFDVNLLDFHNFFVQVFDFFLFIRGKLRVEGSFQLFLELIHSDIQLFQLRSRIRKRLSALIDDGFVASRFFGQCPSFEVGLLDGILHAL